MEIKTDKNKVLQLVELSKKTGKLKKGINEVTKAIETNGVKFVIVAEDVDPKEVILHIPALCDEKQIPYAKVPSKDELGNSAGLGISTSSIGIVVLGEGDEIFKEITRK